VEGELLQLTCLRRPPFPKKSTWNCRTANRLLVFCVPALGRCWAERTKKRRHAWPLRINLGLAFQLIDDVLDFTSSEEVLGKPIAMTSARAR